MYSQTIHLFEFINYFTDSVLSKFKLEFTALKEITQKANKNQKFKPLCQLHLFYIGRKMCYPCMSIQITRANPPAHPFMFEVITTRHMYTATVVAHL